MGFHVRCRRCLTRRSLPRHLDDYKRVPACRVCGERNYRADAWMNKRKVITCRCPGVPVLAARGCPHQHGSVGCEFNPDGSTRIEELTGLTVVRYKKWIPF